MHSRRFFSPAFFVTICCALVPAALPGADTRPVIVVLGDSLAAGFGLAPGESFPDGLQQLLDQRGLRYRVVNQGISGDTTSGGAARVKQALQMKPAVVIVELGANDGLRGLPLTATRANLAAMIDEFRKSGAKVLLAGITLPRNYGPDYIQGFDRIYRDLAREKRVALIPFLLEGVATNPKLMQPDALHPTAEGARRVAATVLRYLQPLLK
jgi:acyl-CoA thioesterase-1